MSYHLPDDVDKRMAARALVLMAVVGFTFVVYAFTFGPLAAPRVTAPAVPLKLWSTADRAVYAQQGTVNVTVYVQNVGTADASLSPATCNAFEFRVEDLQGLTYYQSNAALTVCPRIVRHLVLPPGATANETFAWNQMTGTGLPLPRGRWYHVVPLVTFSNVTIVESDAALIYLAV